MDQLIINTNNLNRNKSIWTYLDVLNNNKYFIGVLMILLNLGSKYISVELSQTQEKLLGSLTFRRIILFTVFFTATRDIWISFLLTAAFVILVSGIFNEKSNYCMIPKKYRYYQDINLDNIKSEDIDKAKQILQLAEQQEINKIERVEQETKKKKKNYKKNINKLNYFKQVYNS